MMGQCLVIRHRLSQVTGGHSATVFPRAEVLLNKSRVQDALRMIGHRKDMNRYRSMMDFLFCEIFTDYRAGCFRYYEDEGPKLLELVSAQDLAECDALLVNILCVAVQMAAEAPKGLSWSMFTGSLTNRATYKVLT